MAGQVYIRAGNVGYSSDGYCVVYSAKCSKGKGIYTTQGDPPSKVFQDIVLLEYKAPYRRCPNGRITRSYRPRSIWDWISRPSQAFVCMWKSPIGFAPWTDSTRSDTILQYGVPRRCKPFLDHFRSLGIYGRIRKGCRRCHRLWRCRNRCIPQHYGSHRPRCLLGRRSGNLVCRGNRQRDIFRGDSRRTYRRFVWQICVWVHFLEGHGSLLYTHRTQARFSSRVPTQDRQFMADGSQSLILSIHVSNGTCLSPRVGRLAKICMEIACRHV